MLQHVGCCVGLLSPLGMSTVEKISKYKIQTSFSFIHKFHSQFTLFCDNFYEGLLLRQRKGNLGCETTQCIDGVMQQSYNTCILVRQALPRWQGNFCDSYRLRVIVHKQCITIVVKVYNSLGKHFVHKQMCVCARVYVFVIVASIILCPTCIIVYNCAALSGILKFFFVCKKIALDKPGWRQDSFLVGKNLD